MTSTNIEPPKKSNHPPWPPLRPPPLPSFSSLPEDIVVSCLARISKSYYPKLSPVSNSFRWLVLSDKLYKVRSQLKWEVVRGPLVGICYVINNVYYSFVDKKWWWSETMTEERRLVNGLTGLDTEIGTYGGKLVMFWDSFALSPDDQTKQIWCAVILLDKRLNEVWGQIEWVDIVRTVPLSYTLMQSWVVQEREMKK